MTQLSISPASQDVWKELESFISLLPTLHVNISKVDLKPHVDVEADLEAQIQTRIDSRASTHFFHKIDLDEPDSESDDDDRLILSGPKMAKYVRTRPRKPSVNLGTWTISGDSDESVATPASSESLGPPTLQEIRIQGGFRPLPCPRRTDDEEIESLLIGHFNGNEVFHIVTPLEKYLNNADTKTSIGRRFLPEEPDKLTLADSKALFSKAERTGVEPTRTEPTENAEVESTENVERQEVGELPTEVEPPTEVELPTEIEPSAEVRSLIDVESPTEIGPLIDLEVPTEVETPTVVEAPEIPKQPRYKQFIEIRESPVGGFGIFAVKDLKRGDIILVERPILKTSSFTLMDDFRALDDETKEIFMSLHAVEDNNTNEIERIKRANGFQLEGSIGIFAIAARFNHGCGTKRNVKYLYDNRRNVMSFVVWPDLVPAGTELLVIYGSSPTNLYRTFGFRCNCGGCEGLSDQDIRRLRAEEMGIHLYEGAGRG